MLRPINDRFKRLWHYQEAIFIEFAAMDLHGGSFFILLKMNESNQIKPD